MAYSDKRDGIFINFESCKHRSETQTIVQLMRWENEIEGFKEHLTLIGGGQEKQVSKNTINAYVADLKKLTSFLEESGLDLTPQEVETKHLRQMLKWIDAKGISPRTQARIVSGIKTFFKYLEHTELIQTNPAALLEAPKIGRKLPEVLSIEEVDRLINAIDTSKPEGQRNRAILEVLYSCGLRVSELVDLRVSDLKFIEGEEYIVVSKGKGNKPRRVPIGKKAMAEINLYLCGYRTTLKNNNLIAPDCSDMLFLNRRGGKLSRVMVFTIIKFAARKCHLAVTISPHTLRHSFATHLIYGGADLETVKELLGHESITTTEIYTHLDNNYLRETIANYHPRALENNDILTHKTSPE